MRKSRMPDQRVASINVELLDLATLGASFSNDRVLIFGPEAILRRDHVQRSAMEIDDTRTVTVRVTVLRKNRNVYPFEVTESSDRIAANGPGK